MHNSLFENTNCTSIVPFNGLLGSTVGLPKFTKYLRDITYINSYNLSVLIGLILGDAYIKKNRKKHKF